MTTFLTPQIEAVDPALQAVAAQSLHWYQSSIDVWELRKVAGEPHLDGFGKTQAVTIAVIRYTEKTGHYTACVHTTRSTDKAPDMHISTRFLIEMCKKDVLVFLKDIKRL